MANSLNATSAMMDNNNNNNNHVATSAGVPPVHPSPHHMTASHHSHSDGGRSMNSAMSISSKPTPITTSHLRFLIMDAPRQSNLHLYIKECRRNHVTDIVRVCEPTYLGGELTSAGIQLHEMAYPDGHSPPDEILQQWLNLVEERFLNNNNNTSTSNNTNNNNNDKKTIAVHCVAGLGRAPVLVAIALMEFERMDAVEAVMMIRNQRRGAINEKQLRYLEGYKRRRGNAGSGCACIIL
eukprot:CAMPEP_0183721750 /NCGR_PEP_ID=MMETSP0737-20130205/13920_1 /TAXON_ID=385413 /ORGANISM="Thalassiosira miniscula, Strain CCMP1093" /LENGTH=237 /DNA_ID=CAMNT_0025951799 /DNA_START=333 /DNA_END=1046 /DNA_ORIENTATION=+